MVAATPPWLIPIPIGIVTLFCDRSLLLDDEVNPLANPKACDELVLPAGKLLESKEFPNSELAMVGKFESIMEVISWVWENGVPLGEEGNPDNPNCVCGISLLAESL